MFHVVEDITVTLRAQSSYIIHCISNGFTRSVTTAPCCDCAGGDPCADVDVPKLIDQLIAKFAKKQPGLNSDNVSFATYQFQRVGNDKRNFRIFRKNLTK
jgi:hypothetical protein